MTENKKILEVHKSREVLLDILGISNDNDIIIHYNHNLHENDFTKQSVRNHYFKTIFEQDVEWIEEQMNIENLSEASISIAYLLEFISFHDLTF